MGASVIAAKHNFFARYRGQVIADIEEVTYLVDEPYLALFLGDVLANNYHAIGLIAGVRLVFKLGHLFMEKL